MANLIHKDCDIRKRYILPPLACAKRNQPVLGLSLSDIMRTAERVVENTNSSLQSFRESR